ncbi:MAG: DUF58 domain-containing protein [Thermaerobacter sp.]|nr:DUF58 domain-containing protein [Thermaerobacter sp.]
MKIPPRLPGIVPILALTAAAFAAGGRIGAAIGGVVALILLLGASGALGSLRARHGRAQRSLPDHPIEAGRDVTVAVEVDLPRLWPLLVLSLRDVVPEVLGQTPALRVLAGFRRRLVFSYTLRAVPRGLHRFSEVSLSAGDALLFAQRRMMLPCPGELLVYPQRVPLEPPPPLGGPEASDRLPRGTRDFQPGDAPGRLHAARTAQRGFPQVREFERIGNRPRVLLLWAPDAEELCVELLLSCAASLAASWLFAGEAVGLIAAGAADRTLAPLRGQEQERRLLARLSALSPQELSADALPRITERGDLWLLSTRPDVPMFGAVRVLRVGEAAGDGALLRLEDLPAHLARLSP